MIKIWDSGRLQILLSITPCSPICTRFSMFPWFLSKVTEVGVCMFENQGPGFQIRYPGTKLHNRCIILCGYSVPTPVLAHHTNPRYEPQYQPPVRTLVPAPGTNPSASPWYHPPIRTPIRTPVPASGVPHFSPGSGANIRCPVKSVGFPGEA